MDPEQVYQEVLAEEQQKGSAAPVAEGRAKAARQRASHGSPHPKEPKWWPGSQPQFEGGGGGAPAAAEEEEAAEEATPEPVAAAPAPPPPAPAAPAPAPEPAAAPAAAQAPAAPAAVAAAPAAATAQPAQSETIGVTHGTPTGNRLRPEDAVASEAQFDGERAMRERRKLIDELVGTGVPAVTAHETGGGTSPLLLLLYILIPVIAIGFLVMNEDELGAAPETPEVTAPEGEGEGEGEGGPVEVVASGTAFDTDTLTLPAEGEGTIHFVNEDSVPHNIGIYEDDSASAEIFVGETITADEIDYTVPGPGKPGEAFFRCDVHPAMAGTVTFE